MFRNGNRKWWQRTTQRSLERCPRRVRSRLRIEALESRYAPSCSTSILGGVLTVNCDNSGNTVNVDHSTGTSVTTVNGLGFSDAAFSSIRINGGAGHDTDNLLATPAKTTVVNDTGASAVNVGKAGSTLGILGELSIENPPNLNTITVDDSADTTNHNIGLGEIIPAGDTAFGTITNLAGAEINYEYGDTSSVTIKTGHGANTVIVLATGVPTTLVGNANATVRVGDGGFLNGIQGALTVTNPPAFTALTLDDSFDTAHRIVSMSVSGGVGTITGLAPAAIRYNQSDVSAVTVDGGPNNGVGGNNTYTVANTVTNGTNPLTTVNLGGAFGALVIVQATSGPLTVTSTGSSNQLWTVGVAGSVQGIHGALTFNTAISTAVDLGDSADGTGRNVTINDTSIVGLAPAVINYQGHTGIFIDAGNGANTFTVNGNSGSAGSFTNLHLGSGASTVNVRATTVEVDIQQGSGSAPITTIIGSLAPGVGGTVANIQGVVAVAALGPQSTVVVDDSGDATARTATFDSIGEITGLAPAKIIYGTLIGTLQVNGGQGGNTFQVARNSDVGTLRLNDGTGNNTVNVDRSEGPVTIEGQGGNDTINLGNTSDGTASIQSTVTVGSSSGHVAVNVNDQANPFIAHVTLSEFGFFQSASGLGGSTPFTLQCVQDEVSSLTINGGSHGNTFNVQFVAFGLAVTLHTGSGNDLINVGDATNTLDGIHGALTVDGQAGFDTLNVNDQGETTAHNYTINATSVVRSPGGPTINYFDIESLNVHPGKLLGAGPNGNVVDVQSTDANTAVEVDAGGGATVNVGNANSALDDLQGPLNVYGDDGSVTLNVNDQGSADSQNYSVAADTVDRTGAATISYQGVADLTLNAGAGGNQIDVQSLAFGTPATVNAGAGGDLIRMRGGPVNAPLTLDGKGNTRLGYIAYTTPVFVDVQTGQATDVKGGFSGIHTITGGSNVNILVGDGTDNLNGAPGSQNLLISGGGSGLTLTGGGGVGDILIDGTTAYDADANGELEAIMAEWTRTDIPYSQIVDNIRSGSDTTADPYPLDVGTVFDNGAQNNLVGHPVGGSEQELNLYYVTNNTSDDATPGETVINVSGGTAPSTGAGARLAAPAAASLPPAGAPDGRFQSALTLGQSSGPPAARLASNVFALTPLGQTARPAGVSGPPLTADLTGPDAWQPWTPSDGALG